MVCLREPCPSAWIFFFFPSAWMLKQIAFVQDYVHLWMCLGKHTDWNRPPWPGTIVTIHMSC